MFTLLRLGRVDSGAGSEVETANLRSFALIRRGLDKTGRCVFSGLGKFVSRFRASRFSPQSYSPKLRGPNLQGSPRFDE
jgi:hypothetical protein